VWIANQTRQEQKNGIFIRISTITMTRKTNTDILGKPFSSQIILEVWQKGTVMPKFSPDEWRWDVYGKVMKWADHGNRRSSVGWEVDHINPVSNEGDDHLDNLQPLYWKDNEAKGDKINWSNKVASIEK
jgi:hypothetical protein